MKKLFILLLFFLHFIVWADNTDIKSPWAKYIDNPSDENAKHVFNVDGGDTDRGFPILKKQIEKGSIASLELAIRLEISKTSGLDGEAAETIPEIVSYGAGRSPKAYIDILEKFSVKECLDIRPMGEEYVDGENKQKMYDEYLDKYNKIKNLKKSLLQKACLKTIESSMKEMTRLSIGVLEEPQCKKEHRLKAKVLFQKQGDTFVESSELEKPLQWYIAFDGRYLGKLSDKVVKIRNRSKGFGGWCSKPTYRPLVLVSRKNFKDPEKWKPFTPKRKVIDTIFPLLKKQVKNIKYREKDIKLLKSYNSSTKKKLIQVTFDLEGQHCNGTKEAICEHYWFYIKGKVTKYIGINLELIDAGDYDNDGLSEVLFWHSSYDEDGYKLFYNNFEKSIKLYWRYH